MTLICIYKVIILDKRAVFDYGLADWEDLFKTLSQSELSRSEEITINNGKTNDSACTEASDINDDWQRWTNLFLNCVALYIPQNTIKRRSTPPWFDSEVKHLMKKKETARRKAKKTLRRHHWAKFRKLRRFTNNLISKKRLDFYHASSSKFNAI